MKKKGKIFGKFVDTFMKIKQESSGFTSLCYDENGEISDELVDKFIFEYYKHEGVKLDKNNITSNPGKRTVMKAILNALWGKLAQNEDRVTVSFLDDFLHLLDLVNDNTCDVTSLDFISDKIMRTTHGKTLASNTTMKSRNVVVAAFVTSYARLELYEALDELGNNVLYYDNDSIIFKRNLQNMDNLTTSEYLGDLTDEVDGKHDKNTTEKWIDHFILRGPKSYSYRTNTYETIDKKEIKLINSMK